jgi:hypothetical protein
LEDIRERLVEMVKTMPEDKLQMVFEFANRIINENQEGEYDPDDELLMT